MERMIVKHLSGSKANQVEEFAAKHHNEIILGRDPSAAVRYDPDRDDLVGRQHARIAQDPNDPDGFLLTDLNSTNGTFLNKNRVNGTVKLNPGDHVQLGPSAPEFTFDVEPRPAGNSAKATRIETAPNVAPATRIMGTGSGSIAPNVPPPPMSASAAKAPGTVGKATVERMISQTVTETKKSQGRKFGLIGGIAALAVLILFGVVIGGAYWYSSSRETALKSDSTDESRALR